MSNDIEKKSTTIDDDGFNTIHSTDRPIVGIYATCIDGNWAGGGEPIPAGTKLVALAAAFVLQRWEEGGAVENIPPAPGQSVDALWKEAQRRNGEIPEADWEVTDYGTRPPWSVSFIVYLLNVDTAEKYTFANSTWGARRAYEALQDRVAMMRALRGANIVPEVELASAPMPTKRGQKIRPHFKCTGVWYEKLGGLLTPFNQERLAATAVPQIEHQPAAKPNPVGKSKTAGLKPVKPVTISEEIGDSVEF
jgi:hypothetical protein